MDPINHIDSLAKEFLTHKEYALFADLLTTIDRRLGDAIVKTKENTNDNSQLETKQLKYPHDIEITIDAKVFRNSQIGERVELESHLHRVFLKKLGIPDEPKEFLNTLIKHIGDIFN